MCRVTTEETSAAHLLAVLVLVPALQHLQPFGGPLHLSVFLLSGEKTRGQTRATLNLV